jgi:hypothetical protein
MTSPEPRCARPSERCEEIRICPACDEDYCPDCGELWSFESHSQKALTAHHALLADRTKERDEAREALGRLVAQIERLKKGGPANVSLPSCSEARQVLSKAEDRK